VRTNRKFIEEIPSPDIMKVDTEGAELDVLREMGDLLSEIRVLYVEPHPIAYDKFRHELGKG
jgi:FkbM family methyltransferase